MAEEIITKPTENLPATQAKRDIRVVEDSSPLAFLMDTGRFEHMYRIATIMARASRLPAHMKGNTHEESAANCFRVVNQALRWGFDPFAIVDESFEVKGKFGYQGKLVAAVINARAGLKGPLTPHYNTKTGPEFAVVIYGSKEDVPQQARKLLDDYAEKGDEKEGKAAFNSLVALRIYPVRLSVMQGKTDNAMWTKDPEQKLFYSGVAKWARRWKPEILLGVMTEDERDNMVIDPPAPKPPLPGREHTSGRINGNGKTRAIEAPPEGSGSAGQEPAKEEPEPEKLAEGEIPNEESKGQESAAGFFDPDREDIIKDLELRIAEAGNVNDLVAAGAELNKHREGIGEEVYGRILKSYQAKNALLQPAGKGKRATSA